MIVFTVYSHALSVSTQAREVLCPLRVTHRSALSAQGWTLRCSVLSGLDTAVHCPFGVGNHLALTSLGWTPWCSVLSELDTAMLCPLIVGHRSALSSQG